MTRFRVLPYKKGSKGAKALATELGGKVLKLEGSKYKWKDGDCVINWGNGDTQNWFPGLQNPPVNITVASNKLKFFNLMKEQHADIIPKFWTSKSEIPDNAYPIVCRTVLAGHSGAGIVIANDSSELVSAPLYVQYIKKKDEYRVHLGKLPSGSIKTILVQRKARDQSCETPNWQVRNHANGFIFVRNNVSPPSHVLEVAKEAFAASGLDFGAIDVIWNDNQGKAYVLEINTAPGLEGQTVEDYSAFFKECV